jgi:hypothetical protein
VAWEYVGKPVLDKVPDLTKLLIRGGSQNNHDLLRALRRAECNAVIGLCAQALREDFDLPTESLKDRFRAWLLQRKDPESKAVYYICQVFTQQHNDLLLMSVEDLGRLHGAAKETNVSALITSANECFAATNPDQLREDVVSQQVAAFDSAVRTLGVPILTYNGLPPSLKRRMEQHPQGWWDVLRLAFREELKGNERARIAWEMDVLSLLPQQLGSNYSEFEKKFSALDAKLIDIWDELKSFRAVFEEAMASVMEKLEDIDETTSATRSELGQLREETRKGFEQVKESMQQRVLRPPLQLPRRALAKNSLVAPFC